MTTHHLTSDDMRTYGPAVSGGTQPPWAGRDIVERLRGCGGEPSGEDIDDAIAEIERLRAEAVSRGA